MSDESGVLDPTGEIIRGLTPEARAEFEKMGLDLLVEIEAIAIVPKE